VRESKKAASNRGFSYTRLFWLISVAHGFFDIKSRVYFFAGVKDIVGVKEVFGGFE
jgi:hypothetical protein